jgi:nucleoside-diphosphate-sugar epimerase
MPDIGASTGRLLVVTGASSQIGRCLLPRIAAAGWTAIACRRQCPADGRSNVRWAQIDLQRPLTAPVAIGAVDLIHLAPLPLLPPRIEEFAAQGVRRVIAMGSTSRFSKAGSEHGGERRVAASLADAESDLACRCASAGVAWTLFRPTMIYGVGLDRNISLIARFIVRFGFFPLIGRGTGLRQPVHADDLAQACIQALDHSGTHARAYDLAGGELLSYREMVTRVFIALGQRPRFLRLPPRLFRVALRAAAMLPSLDYLTAEMAERMNTDLCFDSSSAVRDFGYTARNFQPPSIVCGRVDRARAGI